MTPTPAERHLTWEGCFNVRDLGGHRTADGRETRWGAIVRSDTPERLSERGWDELRAHGVGTIVDLRTPEELGTEPRNAELATVHVPVIDVEDEAFWARWRGLYDPPRFYRESLEHWRDRFTSAVVAVARAHPGAVLVHCQAGRDRTGLVAALILSLVGVTADDIAADYALTADRLKPYYDREIELAADEDTKRRLRRENVSDAATMLGTLDGLDAHAYLLAGGATEADLAALRARLV